MTIENLKNDQAPHWQILLAEDNIINQEVTKAQLKQLGCQVHIATNGIEAINATEQQDFDLIIMDCNMPKLDGYGATRKIRENEKQQNKSQVPIIAFTADVMQSEPDRCQAAGMNGYLTKPIILKDLKKILTVWLQADNQSPKMEESAPKIDDSTKSKTLDIDNWSEQIETENLLDLKMLGEMRRKLSSGQIKGIIELYLQELPSYLSKLERAMISKNSENLYLAAHKFKGASTILGAQRIVALCQLLCSFGREEKLDKATEALARLKTELVALKRALEEQMLEINK